MQWYFRIFQVCYRGRSCPVSGSFSIIAPSFTPLIDEYPSPRRASILMKVSCTVTSHYLSKFQDGMWNDSTPLCLLVPGFNPRFNWTTEKPLRKWHCIAWQTHWVHLHRKWLVDANWGCFDDDDDENESGMTLPLLSLLALIIPSALLSPKSHTLIKVGPVDFW